MNPVLVAIFVAIIGGLNIWAATFAGNAPLYVLGVALVIVATLIAVAQAFGDIE